MKPDPLAMKAVLRRREVEIQKIIRQMKQDNLNSSPVCKKLEQELKSIKTQLVAPSDKK